MNIKLEKLKREQRILIILNRLTFSNEDERYLKELLSTNKIDWFEVFKYALYHKNSTLCWKNIDKYGYVGAIPKYLNEILRLSYIGIREKNKIYQQEKNKIVNCLKQYGVSLIPVKGAMLIPELYCDFGIRFSGDIDFLVKFENINKLEAVLKQELGYTKGEYDEDSKLVVPVSRAEEIKWKLYMSNLFPFCKATSNEILPSIKLDFRFALDDSLDHEPVNEIIDCFEREGAVSHAHLLTHLCTHFYDEAKHVETINLYKDLNLIKMCDIREFVVKYITDAELDKFLKFIHKFHLEKQAYYTFYWLEMLYNDGYEKDILRMINLENSDFINTFGKNTIDNQISFKDDPLDRLFLHRIYSEEDKIGGF